MIVSKKHRATLNTGVLCLGGTTLEEIECYKYFGVLVKTTSWSDHIAGICSKAKQILGMLYTQFCNYSSPESLKQLYLSLVRSNLE